MVSGTISLPSRGTFHHSLTVLSTIGHQEVFRQPSGLGRFTQDSTSPVLLGHHPRHTPTSSAYGGITHYATPSQTIQLQISTHPVSGRRPQDSPTTPHTQPLPSITRTRLHVQDSHPLRRTIPDASANTHAHAPGQQPRNTAPHNTTHATPARYHTHMV